MLEYIIRRKWYLQKHLDAPLLKEREEYLTLMYKKGLSHSYLLSIADYLLLIVQELRLTDDENRMVSIQEIFENAECWAHTIKNHPMKRRFSPSSVSKFKSIAFKWLSHIGRMDYSYVTTDCILNRLFSRSHHKLRYLNYPLKDERTSHLEKWERMGAATSTLRQIAAYHLHAIDLLHPNMSHSITEEELLSAADKWASMEKSSKDSVDGQYARKRFINIVRDWLIHLGVYIRKADNFPLKPFVMEYLDWLKDEKGFSLNTIESRYSMIKNFMGTISPNSFKDITPQTLDNYLAIRKKENGYCRRTIAGIISVLRNFFTYGETKGWNSGVLAMSMNAPRQYRHDDVPSFVPWEVVQNILMEKSTASGVGKRDYAIFLLLSIYGMRCSEVANLKLRDIDWRNEQIHLNRAKGCKSQTLPLITVAGTAIISYLKDVRYNQAKDEHLFLTIRAPHSKLSTSSIYKMVRDALVVRQVNLRHYGPHSLRHSCATHLINTGYSLKEIADLLGHMRLDTTRIYAKTDMTSLREVADMNWEGLL